MGKCKFGFGDWWFLRISGKWFYADLKGKETQILYNKSPYPLVRGSRPRQIQLFPIESQEINFKKRKSMSS